jgi:uncharacterized protein YraI
MNPFLFIPVAAAALWMQSALPADAASVNNAAYLYAGPGYNYAKLLPVPRGAHVGLGPCQNSWCEASYGGRSGWLHQSFVSGAVSGISGPGNTTVILRKRSRGSGISMFGLGAAIGAANRNRGRGGGTVGSNESSIGGEICTIDAVPER